MFFWGRDYGAMTLLVIAKLFRHGLSSVEFRHEFLSHLYWASTEMGCKEVWKRVAPTWAECHCELGSAMMCNVSQRSM